MLGLLLHGHDAENIVEKVDLLIETELLQFCIRVRIEIYHLVRQCKSHSVDALSSVSVSEDDARLESVDRVLLLLLAADGIVQVGVVQFVDKIDEIDLDVVSKGV